MTAVEHDLNTVRASADIAVGQMAEALSDALRRNWTFLNVGLRGRLPGTVRQRRETKQPFPAVAPSHVLLRFLNFTTSLHGFHAQPDKAIYCGPAPTGRQS